jgi:hypothetical protein
VSELTETIFGMQFDFPDATGMVIRMAERRGKGEHQLVLSPREGSVCVFNQDIAKDLLPYLQEFVETGHFGRRPIHRAFMHPSIERLAETDPLLASVRQHVLSEVEDDAGAVHALVRLLSAYSETLTESVRQVVDLRRGLEETVFAGIEPAGR